MRVWKRASAAFKDKRSLWQASLTRRNPIRNPHIDKAVIRVTSHRRHFPLDRRNIHRVCQWLCLSPLNLTPILRSISSRILKTRDWSVVLKGLLLTHALLSCKSPALNLIGRLPFDLSNFEDGHAPQSKAWPFNAFVRAYFAFLDHKSATLFHLPDDGGGFLMRRELELLQKMQSLADLLLEIKPAALAPLVLDVMDAVIVEIYEVYSRICGGIAMVLLNIYTAEKDEAAAALGVVQKAMHQGDKLAYFMEFCREIGVINACELTPAIDRIPEEGIRELEQIIQGFDELKETSDVGKDLYENDEFRTIVTEKWERFDQDFVIEETTENLQLPDLITFL